MTMNSLYGLPKRTKAWLENSFSVCIIQAPFVFHFDQHVTTRVDRAIEYMQTVTMIFVGLDLVYRTAFKGEKVQMHLHLKPCVNSTSVAVVVRQ